MTDRPACPGCGNRTHVLSVRELVEAGQPVPAAADAGRRSQLAAARRILTWHLGVPPPPRRQPRELLVVLLVAPLLAIGILLAVGAAIGAAQGSGLAGLERAWPVLLAVLLLPTFVYLNIPSRSMQRYIEMQSREDRRGDARYSRLFYCPDCELHQKAGVFLAGEARRVSTRRVLELLKDEPPDDPKAEQAG